MDENGDMHTDDGSIRFASIKFSKVGLTSKVQIYVNGTPSSGRDVGVSQSINTIAGHRYQISYKGSYSGAGSSNPVGRSAMDVLDSTDLNAGVSLLPPGANLPVSDQNAFQHTTFTGTGERVTIRATAKPYSTYTYVTFSDLSVIDLDQGVEEARVGIEELFRDETHTKLNYSVIQKDIDNVQEQIHLILDPVLKQKYQTELDKAQRLMDESKPNFTIEQLVDNPNDEHSSTIIGKADPGAMLWFTGSTSLPKPDLPSDNPRNSILYSVKADEDGNFRFKLPAGNYFKAGEKISIYSTLYGRSVLFDEVVIDTTPPDPPVFQKLTDHDENFVGTAEANSTVDIFDALKQKIASGRANADGNFSIPVPWGQLPLIPYTKYYATSIDSAGNVSENSKFAEVVDTTPPSAKAVKQELHKGDSLPDNPRSLLDNIQDNAGTGDDNLTFSYEQTPDMTKYGFQQAVVKVQDKAGNQTLINVPVFILDEYMTGNGNVYIRAKDFVMYSTDLPLTTAQLATKIKEDSATEVWNATGDKISLDNVLVNGTVSPTPGMYEVSISWGGYTKKVKITMKSDTLSFEEVPPNLTYSGTIKTYRQLLQSTEHTQLKITDDRRTVKNWQLKATLDSPLTGTNGKEFSGNLIYKTKGANGEISEQPLSQVSASIFIQKQAEQGTTTIDLKQEDGCGLVLEAIPGEIYADMDYQASITWTLEDAP
ncbi:Ig-like domain-containing protein [Listeria valentina]|uniref:Ig-like domain-containing protein n=1 Tax=Listeria valentina TaxID=2705293 RepID=UPI0014305453|nr:Ig-like domain-containing protein [Listeria valentina]